MKQLSGKVVWGILLLGLILASGSFFLRYQNEMNNMTIVSIADYRDFNLTAMKANRNIEDIVHELKNAGITAIGIKEVSLRDLQYLGLVTVQSYGEFIGQVKTKEPALIPQLETATKGHYISPVNLVAISPDPSTSAFISERLSRRYLAENETPAGKTPEFFHFQSGGNDYFIINVELTTLEKTQNASTELDVQLGYDRELMIDLTNQGFSLILRPGISKGSNQAYWEEYEEVIKTFNIKTIIFSNQVFNATPADVEQAAALIQKYGIIVGIIETSQQIKYLNQAGLDPLMEELAYQVNRVYSTSNDEFVTEISDRYYRWVRAVVDRSLRLMYILPFKDAKVDASVNLDDTIDVIHDFHATIADKGYTFAGSLSPLDSSIPSRANRMALALSLAAALVLYLSCLFRLKERTAYILLGIGAVLCVAANLLPVDWSKVYALGAATLYPSLSSLLLLLYLRNNKRHSLLLKASLSLGILLMVNALGMYTIVASLADIRYIMNVEIFSGVKLSFLLPLLLFALNYLVVFNEEDDILETIYRNLLKHPTYLVILAGLVGMVMVYVYLARSGNNSALGVSQLELRVREFLELLFLARPRFKEIILGYPCLLVMVYLYHRYQKNLILLVLGFGVVMGSISMTNSFCHVFTSIYISFQRTLAGLLTGSVLALCALTGVIILERFIRKWYFKRKA